MSGEPEPARPTPEAVGRRRAVRDVGLQLVLRGLNLALGVAVTVLLVRGLGDEGFGQWSTVFAVTAVLVYFGDLGLGQAAVRQAAARPEESAQWIGALLGLRTVLAIPATIVAAGVLLVIADGTAMRVTGLLAAGSLLLGSLSTFSAVFQLDVRNDVPAAFELANGVIWGLAVIALSFADAGMIAFAVAFVSAGALTSIGLAAFALRRFPIRLRGSRAHWRHLLVVGLPVGVSTLLILAYGRIDQVLVFELAGDRAAGLYGSAYRILDRATLLPATVMATLFPVLAAAHTTDMDRMRRVFVLAGELLLLASLPFVAFTAVAGEPLVRLLFGAEFAPAATSLAVLMGAFVLVCLGYLAGFTVIVLDLQRRFVVYAVVGLVFNVGLNLLLIPRYGFEAAAWITLGTEVVVLTPTFVAIAREMELRPPLGRAARILGAGLLLTAVLAALRSSGVPFGGLVAAAVVAYPVALLLLGAAHPRDLLELARRRGMTDTSG